MLCQTDENFTVILYAEISRCALGRWNDTQSMGAKIVQHAQWGGDLKICLLAIGIETEVVAQEIILLLHEDFHVTRHRFPRWVVVFLSQ